MLWRFFLLLFVASCATAPAVGSGASAAQELRRFGAFLRAVHPEPNRFVNDRELVARIEASAQGLEALARPTEFEVGRAFHQVIAPLGDFHLQVALSAYQRNYSGPLSLFPLQLVWVEGRLLVDAAPEDWPIGTEVVRIDGQPSADVWAALAPLVIADGRNPTARRRLLEHDFGRYFHLARGMADRYAVTIRLPNGEIRDLELDGVAPERLRQLVGERQSAPRQGERIDGTPWPALQRLDDGTALLRLPSFLIADQEAYRSRVDALFAELGDVTQLVLDVRGNQGGLRTHGVAVLNHVLGAPYRQWRGAGARVRHIPRPFRSHVRFAVAPEAALAGRFPDSPSDGWYHVEGDPLAALMVPHGNGFAGRVVLFADARTNSAANELVLALKHARPDTIFIGAEVGGDCDRHVGEFPVLYYTSDFDLVISVSLILVEHVVVAGCEPGRGLQPDVPVHLSMKHFVEGVDPFLEALAALD